MKKQKVIKFDWFSDKSISTESYKSVLKQAIFQKLKLCINKNFLVKM